ncbi:MoxR family ATPase [Rhodococcus sp. 15-649-2-2]|uniref:AAA family ATPase n=1 Tax=Rhodococcus sp. 15-649-2-2 TaxID=2023140 RepID=UPI002688B912|nr:MoxR family ATPase [Rhodococcus sp. 15-649-2-2]
MNNIHAAPGARLEQALFEVKRVVVGQDPMVERMLVGLLARGHILVEGVPGVAKTLAVRTIADVFGGTFRRLQFTPDLMPGDIVGTRVWRPSTETFDTELGPIFGNLVLADEINRAPAKVQSALLEAMAEKQVSIGGRTFELPDPFLVLATQNPIETDGVYRLPEAQRDRFLLKIDVSHPTEVEEMAIVRQMGTSQPRAKNLFTPEEVVALQDAATDVFVHHAIEHYAVRLVMATRSPSHYRVPEIAGALEYGVSSRGTLGLVAASRALALLRGRDYVLPVDVADLAPDVLAHRLVLTFDAAAENVDARSLIETVVRTIVPPRLAPHESDAERVSA